MTSNSNELTKIASQAIFEKLVSILNYKKTGGGANPEAFEKFKSTFESKEVSNEIDLLIKYPKRALILGAGKDNSCVIVTKEMFKKIQKKAILILKTCRESTLSEDMNKNFLYIELSKGILDQMFVICKEIFYPMLSQSVYQGDNSELISKELMEKFHNFLAHFTVLLGHIKKKTVLPVPNDEIFRNPKINDNEKTQTCEGAVVMWIELIKHILKQEPEYDFRNGNHPNPLTEIEFWGKKSKNLESILTQIQGQQIIEILKFLEKQKSAYHKFFIDIKEEVVRKSKEASQNYKFLLFLEKDFQEFTTPDRPLSELTEFFVPIFHTIRLIWQDNIYYSRPERLIVLIRKICNSLIDSAKSFIGNNIFSKILETDSIAEPIVKLETSREVISKFMTAYFSYKDNDINGWKITRNVIFYRLDAFNDRVGDILNIARSYNEFLKVKSKFIGGIKGEILTKTLVDIFDECTNEVKLFTKEDYQPLDIASDEFNIKYTRYKEMLIELERRVAAVLTQTFDECDTIVGKFKILENFDTILERPSIVVELERKYNKLLELYKQELRIVQNLFQTGIEMIKKNDPKSPISRTMPPIAALLYWTDSLKERINEPYIKFIQIGKRITEKEEFRETENLYHSIIKMLNEFEGSKKSAWDEISKSASGAKQKDYILVKKGELLQINFDPQLLQLLKEIKYLKILNLDIPKEAEDVFQKNNEFKKHISSLENITTTYNNILLMLNDVEKPMVTERLRKIDQILEDAFKVITWENELKITEFVDKAGRSISDLYSIVEKLKNFAIKIEHILKSWKEKPLFKRPPEKRKDAMSMDSYFSADFETEKATMISRSKDFTSLSEVQNALKTAVSNMSKFLKEEEWKNYQHYINSIIINGLREMILANLYQLNSEMDPLLEPFVSVRLILENRKISFDPPLDSEDSISIKGILLGWINSFLNLCTVSRTRVDTNSPGDYMIEIMESFEIQEIVYRLCNNTNELIKESNKVIDSFKEYKVLWEQDFEQSFEEFLKAYVVIPEETPQQQKTNETILQIFGKDGNPITKGVTEYTPTKENFDEKLNELKFMLKKVKNMEAENPINWIVIDLGVFKNELIKTIEQWIDRYKSFLSCNSRNKIRNINDFMNRVRLGTSIVPDESDPNFNSKFIHLLENIRDMRCLFDKIIEIIPSIRGELEILKKHSNSENEDDFLENEEAERYSDEYKMMEQTDTISKDIVILNKEVEEVNLNINDLVDKELQRFKFDVDKFKLKIENFKYDFNRNVPSKIEDNINEEEISKAYAMLDAYYEELKQFEIEKKKNNDMEVLLGISVSENKQIKDCLNELNIYKHMWDYISLVYNTFENWKKIKMEKVDANDLNDKIELFKQQLKVPVRKELKNIPAYTSLLKKVSNMEDTISVINTLKEKAIKPRHWKNLIKNTGKHLPYDNPDFSVDHLIKLEIYKDKDKCDEEKTTATEQLKIESSYIGIEKYWHTQTFMMDKNLNNKEYDFMLFNHTKMEVVIENLEKHQVQLIQITQKKTILENFEGMDIKINALLSKLQTVNDVIKTWLKFQVKWEKLETIFLIAEDIKTKLPEDYSKFKELDVKFKEEMKNAYDYSIMADVCNEEKKAILIDMMTTILNCELALNQYLEDKKKNFPRFYFLSNDTLLNMLSYGLYPNIINKNVKDCFDGIKRWDMNPDPKNQTKIIKGMLSAENDEVVMFDELFDCRDDLVEVYLNRFEEKMRKTLKDILYKARMQVKWDREHSLAHINPKDVVPRQKWLEPYPAQLALLVTQNIWTEEVEKVLEELDNGAEGTMKEYLEENNRRINKLIDRVKDEVLTRDLRVKIITIITVDVHARDVVSYFLEKKITEISNFNWKKQLRFYYNKDTQDVSIKIADYVTIYSYEYVGNTGRLVITPLTDRCYITLTQALNLVLGGAPAGPAGTGKTETTKDLGRNLGLGVIVNNCSEQMDIETTARILSGLAQTGFWGCFDEFNRIIIEVLSVVSTQVKTVLDAMRKNDTMFEFEGTMIRLVKTVGFFITMNPGYAGRTELPDNLKALFRSCAMVVPNLENICENMLMSEGFVEAKNIARKFITLYTLSRDLLSKQKHYDWGLRAIKSLLRQAGALKRHKLNYGKPEELIIMNALYDFNKAKIVPDDLIIFRRLLDDLFKSNIQDAKGSKEAEDTNIELNKAIEEATELIKLQKDASFTVKARQLFEILEVRHCMFILGNPGTGKTSIWKVLFHAMKDVLHKEAEYDKLSPKAITSNELFGALDAKKNWRLGILSAIVRKMCKNELPYKPEMEKKWIILDGDIDPDWIESLNTVMDDNKVLTLTSGDRFPLDEYMRLIFEISNLRNATLATVSRGGVLYVTDTDVGTKPFIEKWIHQKFNSQVHELTKSVVHLLFNETFAKISPEFIRDRYIAPMVEINLVQNVCTIFEYLIEDALPHMTDAEDEKKKLIIEGTYFFAFMWGVGGGLIDRKDMVTIVNNCINKRISIPHSGGTCFEHYFDPKSVTWLPWSTKPFQVVEGSLFQDIIVPNVEVERLSFIIKINMLQERPILFIGDAGTGKSAITKYFLRTTTTLKNSKGYDYKYFPINFNSFTDSYAFQMILESQLSVRYGIKYGPLGTTKLIYFLDDLNMPGLDKYGTQSHVELLRQLMDYNEFFDRKVLEDKKIIEDVLFIGCQNPKAGSFKIDLRLQRHFTVISTTEPKADIVCEIYTPILKNHFTNFKLKNSESLDKLVLDIISTSTNLLAKIRTDKNFYPSATKFHYQWNMREIAKIIEGMLRSNNQFHKDVDQLYRLWYHECNRIFKDRLIFPEDMKRYDDVSYATFDTFKYNGLNKKDDVTEPFIFVPFDDAMEESDNYLVQPTDFEALKNYMNTKLEEYQNQSSMPLVLFDDAIMHVSRIARIISNDSSHALLVGVGGSGKQSLSKLAAFIKQTTIISPNLTVADYNREELLKDLKNLVTVSCFKPSPKPYVFMMNDNHILEEYFLVYINSFLSSSWVEEMFENKGQLDTDLNTKIRGFAISEGYMKQVDATKEKAFEFLLTRIKKYVHFVLCMSPVGDKLRVRARKFPGILSCTNIDWFHDWPDIALEKVAESKIITMPQFEDENVARKLSQITAELHKSIKSFNELYLNQERRYNYTTPKSYLELISFFQLIVNKKDSEIENQVDRLEKGLNILAEISKLIADLKIEVEIKTKEVDQKKASAGKLLESLEIEQAIIDKEEKIVGAAAEEAAEKASSAARDEKNAKDALEGAEPIKKQAMDEAEKIDKGQLDNFKKQNTYSPNAIKVLKLIYMIYLPKDNKVPDDFAAIKAKVLNTKNADQVKNDLLEKLKQIEWLDEEFLQKVSEYREKPFTDEHEMSKISQAVGKIMSFFHNLCKYKQQYDICKPLAAQSEAARAMSDEANRKKEELEAQFAVILEKKRIAEEQYNASKTEKEQAEAEQKKLVSKLEMAEKFISLLSGNKARWNEEVAKLREFKLRLAGDCLMASSFVSYIGVFNSFFREKLLEQWKQIILQKDVQITNKIQVVNVLITDSQILKFKAEGLPDDPFSKENAAIIVSCTRWPLIVDPQMQAVKWLKGMSAKKTTLQYKSKGWEAILGNSISSGDNLIMEDLDQELDPLLSPILARETYKKTGGSKIQYIKVGSEEYEFNLNSKLFFITKISNPHYKPEIIAQCTFINFIVTEKGLEDQLLAMVVNIEQPDLEETIKKCWDEINASQAELIQMEDQVLRDLKEADQSTILDNVVLVTSLELTKNRANEIEEKSKISEQVMNEINIKRELYRKVGQEGAMLFFLISKLFVVQHMYQYSLESFNYFFEQAINRTEKSTDLSARTNSLVENIRVTIYLWVSSGMFEKDKQLFLTMISLRLLQKNVLKDEELKGISNKHIDYLLKCLPKRDSPMKTMEWMDQLMWERLNSLSDLEGLNEFAIKMQDQPTKFKEWFNDTNPEETESRLPNDWRRLQKHSFLKILVLRCCRPDRVGVALQEFVKVCVPKGREFLEARTFTDILEKSYHDSNSKTPIFFILSPGSNPIKELEVLGRKINPKKKFELGKNFFTVAMGQNADIKAENYLLSCNTDGSWLFLQNIHLMPKWLKKLQDKLKELSKEPGNEDFRLYLSAEPRDNIPVGILEKCIKLTNEPPSGLKENMKIAFNTLKNENPNIEEKKRMNIIFGLSYFHAVVLERKKFGSLGWNRNYPFNLDDLRSSDAVVAKYLDLGGKIPWDDLRYIVGEIMYGGHIVDDWDRILNNAYLEFLLTDKINEDLDLIPYPSNKNLSLKTPANNPNFPFEKWAEYIDKSVETESPALFGLHPNAELDYRVTQSKNLFEHLKDLEPKEATSGLDQTDNPFEKAKLKCDELQQKANEGSSFNIEGLKNSLGDEKSPYQNVLLQECEQMKHLCDLIKRNTSDIKAAVDGQLTINEVIEALIDMINSDRVPPKWIDEGFASNRSLASWIISLELRISQYKIFESEQIIPRIVFINRLFNPLSYLTAIRQIAARENNAELDKLDIYTEPTNIDLRKGVENIGLQKEKSGIVPIYGLHLQGARYDTESKVIEESLPREDYCVMPVINCKVVDIAQLRMTEKGYYLCPVYKTTKRDATYVTTAQFRTKVPAAKWIIAGVACILDCEKADSVVKYPK